LFHRQEKRETLRADSNKPCGRASLAANQRRALLRPEHRSDHEAAVGFFSFAVCLDSPAVAKMLVYELTLDRIHRLKSDRSASIDRCLDCLIGGSA
jgi:hypothetical protein